MDTKLDLRQPALENKMFLRRAALVTKRYLRRAALDTKKYLKAGRPVFLGRADFGVPNYVPLTLTRHHFAKYRAE